MPAELFPIAFIGALLLLWAALRGHLKQKNIAWGLGIAIFFLISTQTIAILSGLASGSIKPVGWIWAIALTCIALYTLAIINIGLAGISLIMEINFINKQ
jgi:multisubunit Na+/H+ antiporter MnhE subunit